ncbi:MAG TPA: succinate dehydrogenase cytochrome b subunit [Propioniciclava tarda]|nr:succinate dehydrogenase cytochrome b subunit [Propioniciclava tarda]HQA31083.1 succinate dehydrogenase cytochrome b subunit [Propioniciclava tarda]HQD61900.1 succinate dehydrogenase cytochrome b subunit [Propioniciclava tarda]
MKALMAVTGIILIVFLLMHMVGNLKMFVGADSFNHYAEWLKGMTEDGGIAYPILPQGTFIWLFRLVLLACIVAHMVSAWQLTVRDRAARGDTNYVVTKRRAQTYSARTMRWGGVILAGFLVFHLLQFTVKAITTGFKASDDPYTMFVKSFSGPMSFMVVVYAIWLVSVCMHVRHAVWSSLTTLGLNTSERARGVLNALAMAVAVLLFLGFIAAPLACALGWIH